MLPCRLLDIKLKVTLGETLILYSNLTTRKYNKKIKQNSQTVLEYLICYFDLCRYAFCIIEKN